MPLEKISQRDVNNGPILGEDEGPHFSLSAVTLYFDEEPAEGRGTLHVTTRRVVWLSEEDPLLGYAIDFYHIMCHALARETGNHFMDACVYCQLDSESDEDVHEVRFVPHNVQDLERIYQAFSECALMNPDPDEEGEGEFVYNEAEVNGGTLERLESLFVMPTAEQLQLWQQEQQAQGLNGVELGQFDDATHENGEEEAKEEEEEEEDAMEM